MHRPLGFVVTLLASLQAVASPCQQDQDAYRSGGQYILHDSNRLTDSSPNAVKGLELAAQNSFQFENPSLDCKYSSQPLMYDKLYRFALWQGDRRKALEHLYDDICGFCKGEIHYDGANVSIHLMRT